MTQRKSGPLVRGLVAGTRKAGTTWLYENFRLDPAVVVSEQVKESGYFAGTGLAGAAAYERLFDEAGMARAVEVDTSVCYHADACRRIMEYNPDMKVVLIFRDPVEFLVSRHRHSLRKGELREESASDALASHAWLRDELDYRAIVERFAEIDRRGQLAVFDYGMLKRDPRGYYGSVKAALGCSERGAYAPFVDAVNVARVSTFPAVSRLMSEGAKLARKYGAHGLVNRLKAHGIQTRFERNVRQDTSGAEARTREALERLCPGAIDFYERRVATGSASSDEDGAAGSPGHFST